MAFHKGDKVRFLNETGEGVVLEILISGKLMVEKDGFPQEFKISELVPSRNVSDYNVDDSSVKHKINADDIEKKEKALHKKFKHLERYGHQDQIIIDLHIHKLIDSYRDLSNAQIVEIQMTHFRSKLNSFINKKAKKLIVIHGKGKGKLKAEIINELDYYYPEFKYHDAPFYEFGYNGATEIILR